MAVVEEVEAAVDPEAAFEEGRGGGAGGVDGVGGGHCFVVFCLGVRWDGCGEVELYLKS